MRVWISALLLAIAGTASAQQTLLNSSYDIARELFAAVNPKFQAHWQEMTGEEVSIQQSHSGSSKQARAILQGLSLRHTSQPTSPSQTPYAALSL